MRFRVDLPVDPTGGLSAQRARLVARDSGAARRSLAFPSGIVQLLLASRVRTQLVMVVTFSRRRTKFLVLFLGLFAARQLCLRTERGGDRVGEGDGGRVQKGGRE